MKVFFCTACEAGLGFGDRRCDHCGELVGTHQLLQAGDARSPTRLAQVGAFFESQAGLSLTSLVVFLGLGIALLPVGWNYARLQSGTPTADLQTRRRRGPRLAIQCRFSLRKPPWLVAELLQRLGTSIAFGPNKNGAYELAVSDKAAPALAELLNKAEDTVDGVFVKPLRTSMTTAGEAVRMWRRALGHAWGNAPAKKLRTVLIVLVAAAAQLAGLLPAVRTWLCSTRVALRKGFIFSTAVGTVVGLSSAQLDGCFRVSPALTAGVVALGVALALVWARWCNGTARPPDDLLRDSTSHRAHWRNALAAFSLACGSVLHYLAGVLAVDR